MKLLLTGIALFCAHLIYAQSSTILQIRPNQNSIVLSIGDNYTGLASVIARKTSGGRSYYNTIQFRRGSALMSVLQFEPGLYSLELSKLNPKHQTKSLLKR